MTDHSAESALKMESSSSPNAEEKKILQKFPAFTHAGTIYDLSHLNPSVVHFVQAGADGEVAKVYKVNLIFTQHCFTRKIPKSGSYDATLLCRDGREERLFDFSRWELSRRLPGIMRGLAERTCQHAKLNNFVTSETIVNTDQTSAYDVFFAASKALRPGFINLIVQSAYIRETKQTGKRVNFLKILYSALHGKKLKS